MTDRRSDGESTAEREGVVDQQGAASEKIGDDGDSVGERSLSPEEDPGTLAQQRSQAKDVADQD
jgi:hypothetical protein